MSTQLAAPKPSTRRQFLSGGVALSATGLALLGGSPLRALAAPHSSAQAGSDLAIINVALTLEHEGISAYQIGAESGLLKGAVLDTAVLFKSHHEGHREVLVKAIRSMGGTPVEPESMAHYKKSKKLNIASIRTAADVLRLARRLELGAIHAYVGVIPSFDDRGLAQAASVLIADETMHYTALTQALGEPLPRQSMSFGS